MYVEEIILEGFKTYMNRTVISSFDPQFNAITGLNGSGKSNILDAIQFLLGSTSKEMLRLKTGLTELIYKEGFAGIEKASVTIRFRCADKSLRPTGFENSEELSVTRQITKDKVSKFFVNGQNSNLSKVRNLFRSVQLNIQNPHFLVKQGQITKIINLKPLELLSMIEETAGTAYYNRTRTESDKIIQRKEQKLSSINQILQDTIKPQMEKLEVDRKKYAAFKEKEVHAERLNKKIKKHEYCICLLEAKNKELQVGNLKQESESRVIEINKLNERLVEIDNQIKVLRSKGDHELIKDYNQTKALLNEKENIRRSLRNRISVIQEESLKLREQAVKSQQDLERLKEEKQWHQKQIIQYETQLEEFEDLIAELDKSKNAEDASKLIEKQIRQQEQQIANIKNEIQLLEGKRETIKKDSELQKKTVDQAKLGMEALLKNLKEVETDIEKFKNLPRPHTVEDPEIGAQELRRLQNEKRILIQEDYRLNFKFNSPSPNFDRRLVKGKIFMLIEAKQSVHEKALQIGARGSLYNIVIENETVSETLLKAETFGANVTLIPNNKVRPFILSNDKINNANTIATQLGGMAKPAFELINFPAELRNSIMHVFGSFIICSSSEIARKIAYGSKHLSCKCVTYDGDVLEHGTLTGGSDSSKGFILTKYGILRKIEQKIQKEIEEYEHKNQRFQKYLKETNEYRILEKEVQTKVQRREKIKQKLSAITITAKPRDYSEEITHINKKVESLKNELKQHETKLQELGGKSKKGGTKSVQQQKEAIKKDQTKCEKRLTEGKKQIYLNEAEIERLNNSVKVADQTQGELSKQMVKLEKDESEIINIIKDTRLSFEQLEQKKLQLEKEQAINNTEIQLLNEEREKGKARLEQNHDFMREVNRKIEMAEKAAEEDSKNARKLLNENRWLEVESAAEIDPEFDYQSGLADFNKIQIEIDKLRKTVKVNVDDHSYNKLTEQYNNLLEKKAILENDKLTLLTNMHDLDEKRTKTLEKCFLCVKENLGSIFNDLLPGATAHLSLIDENDVTKGAQLRVHFNEIKKELSELSGGQRSLLALSFILALLLYKPSPFYILDEIDSALDLSHTENIGYMISKRFPQSQFILISLKEGMFQNANVLYKVHFSEGESKVDRQVLKKKVG